MYQYVQLTTYLSTQDSIASVFDKRIRLFNDVFTIVIFYRMRWCKNVGRFQRAHIAKKKFQV